MCHEPPDRIISTDEGKCVPVFFTLETKDDLLAATIGQGPNDDGTGILFMAEGYRFHLQLRAVVILAFDLALGGKILEILSPEHYIIGSNAERHNRSQFDLGHGENLRKLETKVYRKGRRFCLPKIITRRFPCPWPSMPDGL